ncbi:hypothetical protein [Acinetobacter soli]|uniref:hypothetical protein n=1 Tax=Acinetobacter soli TaxID=487316 RepID=UPI000E5B90E6|nr:hypothetical protein [Acinetobacter soli]
MVNFTDSIKLGMQTALDRERNFKEIHDLFSSLREQILDFSDNLVTLELVFLSDPEDETSIKDYFESYDGLYLDKSLCLINVNNPQNFEWISFINFSSNGYPCTLDIVGNRFDAIDRISLEENINTLLATPSTGQKLFELMKSAGKL